MRQFVRSGLAALIVVALSTVARAQGPGAPQAKGGTAKAATPGQAQAPPARPAILDQVLATVNGAPITRADLYEYLNNFGITPGQVSDADMYRVGIETLANSELANQYLASKKVPVPEKDIDAEFANLAEQLKKDGRDVNVVLASYGLTVAKVREEMKLRLTWRKYIEAVATEPVLMKYMDDHKDIFSRSQVKASHIVLRVDPTAPEATKAEVRKKLAAIKAEVESGKITFADAANKYSEDEGNKVSPNGGDLGYFTRRGQFNEQFTKAAFALKPSTISAPVETPFGYHLIQVVDRKPGTPVDFKQNQLLIRDEYAVDLQERIVAEMRKTAKIDVKPMPADLFPKAPTPTQGAGPAGSPEPGRPATPTSPGGAIPK